MAAVESAADGLALAMPTALGGLGLPPNFSDQPAQIDLHHHYHHQQLHQQHQAFLNQQSPLNVSHNGEDQKALHCSKSSSFLVQMEVLSLVNADGGHASMDHSAPVKLAFASSIVEMPTSTCNGITSNPQLAADALTASSKHQIGNVAGLAAPIKASAHADNEFGIEKSLQNGSMVVVDRSSLNSIFDQVTNVANAQKLDGGSKAALTTLPTINPHVVNADSLTQSGKDSTGKLGDQPSKLNPLASEFVPSSFQKGAAVVTAVESSQPKKKTTNSQGRRRSNGKTSKAQREDSIRRTIYVSDIDQQVTEEQLAALFLTCGPVVDCRVCGDPNSVLRFAFVEFMNESSARAALALAGTMLGYYPVRVLPSKTAIVPVNPTFLPRTEDEREMCARTVYCTNIDKKVSQADVKLFFETLCGEVARLRLLGDYRYSTRIAFVEFVQAESAMAALNCSGAILGSLPLRVSPSKTPVRPRSPRFL